MQLDPAIAIDDDLWTFRCTISVSLYDPKWVDGHEVQFLVRTYGVSAGSFAEAGAVAEDLGGRAIDAQGAAAGSLEGWVEDLEISLMDPQEVEVDGLSREDLARAGCHYASPPLYFDEEGVTPDGDRLEDDD